MHTIMSVYCLIQLNFNIYEKKITEFITTTNFDKKDFSKIKKTFAKV